MKSIKHQWIQDPIVLNRRDITVLVLENPRFFREFVSGIEQQIEGEDTYLICLDGAKEFQLSKCARLITDLFAIPIDEKKSSTLLYKDIEKNISEEARADLEKLSMGINTFISDVIEDYSLPLTYSPNFSLSSLMKMVDLKPEYRPASFLQSILDRIRTLSTLFNKNLFFLVNLHDVLDRDELTIFYQEIALMDIDVVVVDAREPKDSDAPEKVVIIDQDLCEILK